MAQITLEEQLLQAWVKLTGIIKNSRITKGLAYNEAVIMLLAYNRCKEDGDGLISMKELVAETNMLKSLVNRTVNSLEKKGLLQRCTVAGGDRRISYVRCTHSRPPEAFLAVHNHSLALAGKMLDVIGKEDAEAFVRIAKKISRAAAEGCVLTAPNDRKEQKNEI